MNNRQFMATLTDFDLEELSALFASWGQKPAQAARLLPAFYRQAGRVDFKKLELGSALERRLKREVALRQARILAREESADGTIKLLLGLTRGGAVETVLTPTPFSARAAGCVSTQIGCAMGCAFCASAKNGFVRNLATGEMIEQFLFLRAEAAQTARLLHTLVFMGMGEPMNNLDNVITAIRRIGCAELGGVGWRQITVSTVGLVSGMDRLAEADLNINLALSLHAPDDATRSLIVPANRRHGVAAIVAAAKRFYQRTGRITNIEYCLLKDLNDSAEHARKLAALLAGFRTHVNLIPYNQARPEPSGLCAAPPPARARSFLNILREAGIAAHLRQARGGDINAACGQLYQRQGPKGRISSAQAESLG
jgi:23S rRNA (adenine2503-C2)-methyltransferase